MQHLHTSTGATALSKAAATWLPRAGRSGGTRATGISPHDVGRVNGRRSNDAASESARLRYFLLGALFMQLVNVLLNLWLDAAVMP